MDWLDRITQSQSDSKRRLAQVIHDSELAAEEDPSHYRSHSILHRANIRGYSKHGRNRAYKG